MGFGDLSIEYDGCNVFLSVGIALFSPSGFLPETFRIPSGTRAFHLLAYGSAYGPAYGEGFHCLRSCLQGLLTALVEH